MQLVKKQHTHIVHAEYKPKQGNGNVGITISDMVELYSKVTNGHMTLSREDARAFAHELVALLDETEPKDKED